MAFTTPIEAGVIGVLLEDPDVSALVSGRVYPVVVPEDEPRPAVTVARVRTERDPETLESDRVPKATIEVRGIAGVYQDAWAVANACRVALQALTPPHALGEHTAMQAWIEDEVDEFEPDTSELGGTGFYHRVLKYVVDYYE